MSRLKIILFLLLIVIIVGAISIPLFVKETVAFSIPGVNKTISIQPTNIEGLKEDTTEQLATLSTQATKLSDNTGKILGSAIQADTASDSSMANRAIEYGKYLYCKQVVEAYETTTNN